ncbi:MAG: starch-binding protein, partial [Muribaculaceae bacterium]|nr:starch-binding protein [Muribaculaceae bacterium]
SSANWTTPHIHYWGGTASTWPGVAMEKVAGQTWKYDCPAGTTGCLFNAGDGDTTKTGDFTAIHNHIYTTSGDQGVYDPETPAGMPAKLYVIGNLNVGSWSTSNAIEMTKEGASFVARNVSFAATEANGPVYFSFITVTGADWDVVNASNRYGATTKDEELPIGESADIKIFSGSSAASAYAWQLPEAGTYDVIADFLNMQVSVIQSLGAVNSIETEVSAEAPVFYNLQGLRIDNPGRGLFIMVKDGKASKVIR